jgi:hypothetical protein
MLDTIASWSVMQVVGFLLMISAGSEYVANDSVIASVGATP